MGVGKTSAAINYINDADGSTKFLYITPYKTEVSRIISACRIKQFKEPKEMGTKLRGIKYLLERGENIVSTHALFHLFDEEIIELARSNNYVLIMDEVAKVVDDLDITDNDLETILEKHARIKNDCILEWYDANYKGKYDEYKIMCDLESIGIYGNNAVIWLFPIGVFNAFKEVFILTYLFEAQTQKYYFDIHGVEYRYLYVCGNTLNTYNFTEQPIEYQKHDYRDLIHICDNEKLNAIGDKDSALSFNWYRNNKEKPIMTVLKNNIQNYVRNICKAKANDVLWTTFKKARPELKGNGYSKGFISSSLRATNDYRDRHVLAYPINKFFKPYIKNYFVENNIAVNEDAYAISEMIQWIWRSAIRQGEEIWIYLPSSRMRGLLKKWIEEVSI